MTTVMLTEGFSGATFRRMGRRVGWIGLAAAGVALNGCVTLEAPDKPIEINLNINIKQEVVYRLDGEAKNLIKQEADIF